MHRIFFCSLAFAAILTFGAIAQNSKSPIVHIENWDDVKCETGNPVIRLFPFIHEISIKCE